MSKEPACHTAVFLSKPGIPLIQHLSLLWGSQSPLAVSSVKCNTFSVSSRCSARSKCSREVALVSTEAAEEVSSRRSSLLPAHGTTDVKQKRASQAIGGPASALTSGR